MFTIRQQQLDAFRMPYREKVRQQAIAQLQADGFEVTGQPDARSYVARDRRGAETTLTYSDRLLPQTVTKPLGDRYGLGYNTDGQLTQVDFPGGEQVRLGRSPDGLITSLQTAPKRTYGLDYQQGMLNRVTYPGGAIQQFGYDARGLLTYLTNRTGHTRHYVRDELDGKLLALVDPLGRATQFVFEEGHLAGLIYPDGSRQTVAYDEADESLYFTLRDGKGFVQSYQGEHLRELNWQDGPWVRFTNDADGRPLAICTEDSQVTFGYGQHGLATEQGVLGTSVLRYDEGGQLTGIQLPAGLLIGYDYDLNGRLSQINIGGSRIQYEYAAHDLLTAIAYPNGLRQQVTQRHLGGLQYARVTNAYGQTLSEQTYAYDGQDRLTRIEDGVSGTSQGLQYDEEGRVLAVQNGQAATVREQFGYDGAGTLRDLNGWPVQSGPMGEIRAVGADTWQYDALGNATQLRGPLGTLQLEFARNGTLSRLTGNGQTWHYQYDGLGRRIGKTNGNERWQYAWLEGRLVTETYQPTAQAQPQVRQYVYHPDQYTPVAFIEAGQLFIMQADCRGAITHVYDERGTLVWQGKYNAFGYCTETVRQVRQPFRLAGQYADAESGLYYNVGRYYAPFVGQYLSLDPQWLDHLDNHPYAYARQSPYNRHDPLGDIAPLVIAGIIGGAALVGGAISAGITAYQGGSWRQIGASFAHGALSGAGTAVGAMLGGLPGAMGGAAVGGFLGTLAEQAINGEKLCLPCAVQSALIEGLLAGALGLAGKLLGPVLGRLGRAIANSSIGRAIGRAASQAATAVRNGIRRTGQFIKNRFDQFGSKAVSFKPGWSKEKITAIPKGQRPDPSEYLSPDYIEHHLSKFDDGGSYLMPKASLDRFGRSKLGRPDGVFIKTKAEMDDLLSRANGDISIVEKEIGIPEGGWRGKEIVRIDIPNPRQNGIRLPSGNEEGANELWIPGGKLPSGDAEAVLNQIPLGNYTEITVHF